MTSPSTPVQGPFVNRDLITFSYTPKSNLVVVRGSSSSTSVISPRLFSVPPLNQTSLLPDSGKGLSELASLFVIPMEDDRCERLIEPPNNWDPRWEYADYLSPIMNQGSCGSCWAFATVGAMSSRFAFFTNQKVKLLSSTYLVMCATPEFSTVAQPVYGCFGGNLAQAFWFLAQNGVVAQDCLNVSLSNWLPGDTSIQRRVISRACTEPVGMRRPVLVRADVATTRDVHLSDVFVSCPLNKCITSCGSSDSDGAGVVCNAAVEIPFLYKLAIAYIVGGSEGQQNTSERNIRLEMYRNGPSATGFEVRSDFIDFWKGVLEGRLRGVDAVYVPQAVSETNPIMGNHAVQLIGWGVYPARAVGVANATDVKYWIVANSWGASNTGLTPEALTDWGNNGYFLFVRGLNACGLESNVVTGLPKVDSAIVSADGVTRAEASSLICNAVLYEVNAQTLNQLGLRELDKLQDPIGIYSWVLPPILKERVGHIRHWETCPVDIPVRCTSGSCAQSQLECGRQTPTVEASEIVDTGKSVTQAEQSRAREIKAKGATALENENHERNIMGLIDSYNKYASTTNDKALVSVCAETKGNVNNVGSWVIVCVVFFEISLLLICYILTMYFISRSIVFRKPINN